MVQKVFGDADLTVHTIRNPVTEDENGQKHMYSGLVFQLNCQDCETPIKIGFPWSEVRTLLEGGSLSGVTRSHDGWIIAVQCQNSSEGCSQTTSFSVTDEELERHAALEVTRRNRFNKAQQRPVPQGMQRRIPQQAPRRPMPRR
jgi:hypothetical protein